MPSTLSASAKPTHCDYCCQFYQCRNLSHIPAVIIFIYIQMHLSFLQLHKHQISQKKEKEVKRKIQAMKIKVLGQNKVREMMQNYLLSDIKYWSYSLSSTFFFCRMGRIYSQIVSHSCRGLNVNTDQCLYRIYALSLQCNDTSPFCFYLLSF